MHKDRYRYYVYASQYRFYRYVVDGVNECEWVDEG